METQNDQQTEMTIPKTVTPWKVLFWNVLLCLLITAMVMLILFLFNLLVVARSSAHVNWYIILFGLTTVPLLLSSSERFRNQFHKEIPQYHCLIYQHTLKKYKRPLFEGENQTLLGFENPELSEGQENYIHLKSAQIKKMTEKFEAKSNSKGDKEAGIIMEAELFVAIRPNVFGLSYEEASENVLLYNSSDLPARIDEAYGFVKQLFSSFYPTKNPVYLTKEAKVEKDVKKKYAPEIAAFQKKTGSLLLIHLFNSNPEKEVQHILDKKVIARAGQDSYIDLISGVKGEFKMSDKEAARFVQQVYAGADLKIIEFDGPKGMKVFPLMPGMLNDTNKKSTNNKKKKENK